VSTWIAILGNEGEEARQKCGRGEKQGSYQGREELQEARREQWGESWQMKDTAWNQQGVKKEDQSIMRYDNARNQVFTGVGRNVSVRWRK
jgi:hypothetical protein